MNVGCLSHDLDSGRLMRNPENMKTRHTRCQSLTTKKSHRLIVIIQNINEEQTELEISRFFAQSLRYGNHKFINSLHYFKCWNSCEKYFESVRRFIPLELSVCENIHFLIKWSSFLFCKKMFTDIPTGLLSGCILIQAFSLFLFLDFLSVVKVVINSADNGLNPDWCLQWLLTNSH